MFSHPYQYINIYTLCVISESTALSTYGTLEDLYVSVTVEEQRIYNTIFQLLQYHYGPSLGKTNLAIINVLTN